MNYDFLKSVANTPFGPFFPSFLSFLVFRLSSFYLYYSSTSFHLGIPDQFIPLGVQVEYSGANV